MSDTTSWHTYPKIYNLGHKALEMLFLNNVLVEEKIDGSQFSFGRFDGALRCRSRGQELRVIDPEKMFMQGVWNVGQLPLHDGWTYRGEYLQRPKHNVLAYDRVPAENVILFDVNTCEEGYLSYDEKAAEAARLGLEVVPRLYQGSGINETMLRSLLETTSILGGQKIEGVVVKNYSRFSRDGKVLMGKFVSEAFKEVHRSDWKERNPASRDIVQQLIERFRHPGRWQKAIQHLKERGELQNAPSDIGGLIKEVQNDVYEECKSEIAGMLFAWAWPNLKRGITAGLPEWYKDELLKKQFGSEE